MRSGGHARRRGGFARERRTRADLEPILTEMDGFDYKSSVIGTSATVPMSSTQPCFDPAVDRGRGEFAGPRRPRGDTRGTRRRAASASSTRRMRRRRRLVGRTSRISTTAAMRARVGTRGRHESDLTARSSGSSSVGRQVMVTAKTGAYRYHEGGHALIGSSRRRRPGPQGLDHPPRRALGVTFAAKRATRFNTRARGPREDQSCLGGRAARICSRDSTGAERH